MTAPAHTAADVAAASAREGQFVTFELAGERFAVPMAPVQEIIRVPAVSRLPLAPAALDGLANLRGRVLPIVNLRRLFGIEARAGDESTRALVIQIGQPLGFVVDRVSSVIQVEPGELQPASEVQGVVHAEYLSGVIHRTGAGNDGALTLVLDFERLVADQFAAGDRTGSSGPGVSTAGGPAADGARSAETVQDELRLVSFTVSEQEYALDIADVREIVQVPGHITALPTAPAHVVGLMSLRQRLLPLVSLRTLFGLPRLELDEQHRIVVVALPGGAQVGLVTDTVKEVLSVPRQQTEAVPGVLARDGSLREFEAICRLEEGRRLVSVIDTACLLGHPAIRDAAALGTDAAADGGAEQEYSDMVQSTSALSTGDDIQVVVFRLGAEEFGVPIMSIQEIVRVPEGLTRVPRTPAFVEGVINLRGTVLPVIDQRRRLGLPAIERNDGQRIMVYTLGGTRTGFIVDAVAEVLRIPTAQLEPAPRLGADQARLIRDVAKLDGNRRMVMLIDPAQLLAGQEHEALQALQPGTPDAGADAGASVPDALPQAA